MNAEDRLSIVVASYCFSRALGAEKYDQNSYDHHRYAEETESRDH